MKYIYDIETNFYSLKTNLYSKKKKRFYYITFLHPIKISLYYMIFLYDTFLVTIYDLPFYLQKSIEKQHNAVRKLLRRIQNIRTLWNES